MKKRLLGFILLFAAGALCAQVPAKVTRPIAKNLGKGTVASKGAFPSYGGINRDVMGVDYYLRHNMPKTAVKVPQQRSWLEQKKRDYKAAQLKKQRRKQDALDLKLQQELQAREALRATLPKLAPEQTFETSDFTQLLAQEMPADPIPLIEEPGILYRGMALSADGAAVKNILENGLRLEDLGEHATTKLLAMSGGMRGTVSAVRPVTNLTSFPKDAVFWANQRKTDDKELLVIVAVKGQTQSGKVVLYSDDIPAEQISHVITLLMIAGKPTWCEVALTQDGNFLVIPYVKHP